MNKKKNDVHKKSLKNKHQKTMDAQNSDSHITNVKENPRRVPGLLGKDTQFGVRQTWGKLRHAGCE